MTRGQKMVEILKQDQNKTLPIEKQVAIIFLGTQGFLDEVPVGEIQRLEQEFIQYIDTRHPHILKGILEKKELDQDLEAGLNSACQDFMRRFSV